MNEELVKVLYESLKKHSSPGAWVEDLDFDNYHDGSGIGTSVCLDGDFYLDRVAADINRHFKEKQ